MTEQELRNKYWEAYIIDDVGDDYTAFCDALCNYADARVAQECKVLDEVVTLLHQTIANRNVEIAELKAESKYWNERWEAGNKLQDAAFNSEIENYHEVKRLNAEIKRLTGALERVMRHHIDESISTLDNYLEMKDIARVAWKASISPAPVTEGQTSDESRLIQCLHCERMFDPSDENDFCLNGTCDAK